VSAPPRLRVLEPLRHRDFRLLWIGQTVSQIGDAAFVVALGWRAFTLTGKASSLGIVLAIEALGLIATLLIGGVLADRYSRRLLLIGSDLARAVLIAGLAVVDAAGLWAVLSGLGSPGTFLAAAMAFSLSLLLLGLADPRIRSVE
jgi:MFS family permease